MAILFKGKWPLLAPLLQTLDIHHPEAPQEISCHQDKQRITIINSNFSNYLLLRLEIYFKFLQSTHVILRTLSHGWQGAEVTMAVCWPAPKCHALTEQLEPATAKCATCANGFINGDTPTEALTDDWEREEQRNWHTVISMHDNKTDFHSSPCRVERKKNKIEGCNVVNTRKPKKNCQSLTFIMAVRRKQYYITT